jgi:hypothetical protein
MRRNVWVCNDLPNKPFLLDTTVLTPIEQAIRAKQLSDRSQRLRQVTAGNVQQAVHGENYLERSRGEVQIEKVHLVCFQALFSAAGDHVGGKVNADDIQVVLLEEFAVQARSRPDFEQPMLACIL